MEELFKKLVETPSTSGYEKYIRDLIYKEIKPHVDDVKIDKIGNLIAKKGSGSPKIMLAAHMDELGLLVKYIDKNGFIKFEPVGGWDQRVLLAQKVIIHGSKKPVIGVIGSKPIHIQEKEEQNQVIKIKDMYIDVGAKNEKDVGKMGIHIGDFISPCRQFSKLYGNRFTGHGLDNRIGCLELMEIMKGIKKFKGTVYAVWTIEEEIGLVGVRGSVFGINPDVFLALDTTIAGDTPNLKEGEAPPELGKGPVLLIKDQISIINPNVRKWLEATAKENKISLQYDVMSGGATDASVAAITREGVPAGALLAPTRYVHTPIEVADMNDIKNIVRLVQKAIESVHTYF